MSFTGSREPRMADDLKPLSVDGERVLCRGWRDDGQGSRRAVLTVLSALERPTTSFLGRLAHEYELRNELDPRSAVLPIALVRERGHTVLLLEDPGGEPLDLLLNQPMEIESFLRCAIGLSVALSQLHKHGLIHKDLKPANVLYNATTAEVRLTGLGIASRLPREHPSPDAPELIAGTLAYMAPEQTGRMNRSVDSRTDLYSLGVTFYQMLTGVLPFSALDPMEWVHCHIARKPLPPVVHSPDAPPVLSQIIMKLLAKAPEERYQTAAGLENDLRHCLAQWERDRRITAFDLGQRDALDRLLPLEKLYGRAGQVERLCAAFDRVARSGAPELVLVSGYSGIGKSAVVNELHRALVSRQGLFASGKFDQYKRDIPYSTLVEAFQSLVHRLLGKSDQDLQVWRDSLQRALEPNGSLIVNLVPELRIIIGEQPRVPDLPPLDAHNRFQTVFRRFIGVFARPEHPLVLFFDDLQWLDGATLELVKQLVEARELRHLLIVGAYRDNEVSASHPLHEMIDAIRKGGVRVQQIWLPPLGDDDVARLIADATRSETESMRSLARLVQEKTGGNPFFTIQFLTALAEEGLLVFDSEARAWQYSTDRIRAKSYTDNVVDLVAGKMKRLSPATQELLKQLAFLGSAASAAHLGLVRDTTIDAIHQALREAVYSGLIIRQDGAYKFLHDRIRQAAYSLIPDALRAETHLRIGRALAASMTADELAEQVFDVANHFNRGAGELTDPEEKTEVAGINLRAGRKAKAAAAYASACSYLVAGEVLVAGDAPATHGRYELAFALRLERAECELVSGNFTEAERLINLLLESAVSKVDKAAAFSLKIRLHVVRSEISEGLESSLECLQLFHITMSSRPSREEVDAEYRLVWKNLKGQSIESLVDGPLITDPNMHAAIRVLAILTGPALYADINLYYLHFCKMVNLSLTHGICDASAFGYAGFGAILCQPFGRYAEGYAFAKLACDLVERHGFIAYKAKVYLAMEMVALWSRPIEVGLQFARATHRAGAESGDLTFASYGCMHIVTDLLTQGTHLDEVWRQSEACLDFIRKGKYKDAADVIVCQQQFIRNLRGQTASFSTFSDNQFDQAAFEAELTDDRMTAMVSRYWILKLQARFMSGDYQEAMAASEKAAKVHWSSEAFLQSLDYHYYTALTIAASFESAFADRQRRWRALLNEHQAQLRQWADNYPPTFADKYALVAAEVARLEGRDTDAMQLYEQAIRSANENGFVQNEGLGYEVGARFYAARGLQSIANAYLRSAKDCYVRWGADGKARQLNRLHPGLTILEGYRPTATIGSPLRQLDVATVLKASQAVSSEIVLPKLIERLMTIAIESAGADRGFLILPTADDYTIRAEASSSGERIEVVQCQKPVVGSTCPESIVRYVIRARESVILDDASRPNLFSDDEYLRSQAAKSILCQPLIKQGQLTAVLYLENTLSTHAFSPDRIAILELLAAQAAISLENTRLYNDLQEREAKIRRLVESNIIGIFIWSFEGKILEANDAFLRMVGYDREDVAASRLRWTDLTPPEWRDRDAELLEEQRKVGYLLPFEKEFFRKDGTRTPVLIGVASFETGSDQGVAFVLDLTERKEAERNLRESERRYREAQGELAHVTRVATLGELTASIAHEVNQPLAAVVNAAAASLRWLNRETPNLDEARRAMEWIIKEGDRAGEVIRRVRALVNKTDTQKTPLDINSVVNEANALVQRELLSHRVSLRTELVPSLPAVLADRVQLQQVIINLLMNAIEAMEIVTGRPSEVVIRSHHEADQVRVTVEDCGIGISAENVDRLFNTFFTTKAKGMGMGLSICRSIIEAHGGRLSATNNPGPGATFQFTLPLHEKDTS